MAVISFVKKVSSLPSTFKPNTMYCVRVGNGFDFYLSDSTGGYAHRLNIPADQISVNSNFSTRISALETKTDTNASNISNLQTSDESKFKDVSVSNATVTFSRGDNTTKAIVINNVSNATNATNATYALTQSKTDASTKIATTAFVKNALADMVASAPSTLDTLNELAAALGDDPNFSTTITNLISTKANASSVYTKSETDSKVATVNNALTNALSIIGLFNLFMHSSYNYMPAGTTVTNQNWFSIGLKMFRYNQATLPGQPTKNGIMIQIPFDLTSAGMQIYIDQFGSGIWVRGGNSTTAIHTAEFKYIGGFS